MNTRPMENGYIPKVGETVKVVGNCHPKMVSRLITVVSVDTEGHSFTSKYFDHMLGEEVVTSGVLGGVEPMTSLMGDPIRELCPDA